MIGAFELMHCIEIPYKVAINEAVELAKSFGGTDGHKYVNGVLDKAAAELRRSEVEAARAGAADAQRRRLAVAPADAAGARSLVTLCYERTRDAFFTAPARGSLKLAW